MEERHENPKNRAASISSSTEYVTSLELHKVVHAPVTNQLQWESEPPDHHQRDFPNGVKKSHLPNAAKGSETEESASRFISKGFRKMYLAALTVLLFPICMGMTSTYSATATADMKKDHSSINPTPDEISWIASIMAVGALFGSTAGGYFSHAVGRKGSLILNGLPLVTGWILIAYAETSAMILIGRFITGFSTGIVSQTTPMYLVEISTPEIRGLLGACFQLFVVVGVLTTSSLGAVLKWRWLAIAGGLVSFLASAFMLLMPESPRWLIAKKERAKAMKSLIFLQGEWFDAEAECQKIEDGIKKQPAGGVHIREFKSPTVFKPLILSIVLVFFHQFSGISAILFYTVDIFDAAHVSLNANVATIIVSTVQLLATLLSTVLMDRTGRRPLLLISAVSMAVSLLVFGGYDYARMRNAEVAKNYGILPVICLTGFITSYSIGFGPTPWLMISEMTSTRFRSVISGIVVAFNWLFAFIIGYTFQSLRETIQAYGVYWLYAAFCISSILMTYFFLPETKGKKIEEMEDIFRRKSFYE